MLSDPRRVGQDRRVFDDLTTSVALPSSSGRVGKGPPVVCRVPADQPQQATTHQRSLRGTRSPPLTQPWRQPLHAFRVALTT
jgi:hypothetical protein